MLPHFCTTSNTYTYINMCIYIYIYIYLSYCKCMCTYYEMHIMYIYIYISSTSFFTKSIYVIHISSISRPTPPPHHHRTWALRPSTKLSHLAWPQWQEKKDAPHGFWRASWNSKQNFLRDVICTWYPKHPFINGSFNWMIPNLYMENGCFTKHPLKTGCLEFQVVV